MHDLVLPAIPFFVLFLVLEIVSFRHTHEDDDLIGYESRRHRDEPDDGPHERRSSVPSGGSSRSPSTRGSTRSARGTCRRTSGGRTRCSSSPTTSRSTGTTASGHEVRVFWAAHVVHHSSQHFNLSTALRQPIFPMTALPFWAPGALFFPPWMIFGMQSVSLIYQFGLHTERIGRLWAPIEFLFNTPSHHRVHHGAQQQYLDRNYGGILIVWDRLFGTFEPEGERVRYGLTKNLETNHP